MHKNDTLEKFQSLVLFLLLSYDIYLLSRDEYLVSYKINKVINMIQWVILTILNETERVKNIIHNYTFFCVFYILRYDIFLVSYTMTFGKLYMIYI